MKSLKHWVLKIIKEIKMNLNLQEVIKKKLLRKRKDNKRKEEIKPRD